MLRLPSHSREYTKLSPLAGPGGNEAVHRPNAGNVGSFGGYAINGIHGVFAGPGSELQSVSVRLI
jgi:hypothetical protein